MESRYDPLDTEQYQICPFLPDVREIVAAFGAPVIDSWHRHGASLHLLATEKATGAVVAHLQAVDKGVPQPSRRAGICELSLMVAPAYRLRGIGGALYAEAERFATERRLHALYAAVMDDNEAGKSFLVYRSFAELERFLPSHLDVTAFEPDAFSEVIRRVEAAGIRLFTYDEMPNTVENRRRLYDLEQASRAVQPFRGVGPYIPPEFDEWDKPNDTLDPAILFLAAAPDGTLIGLVSGIEWYFTGVHPDWQGRGIAMALKLKAITEAKRRGITTMPTENHEDNAPMLAINRKLGFVFDTPEIAYIKRL